MSQSNTEMNASLAMQALVAAGHTNDDDYKALAKRAYKVADAMDAEAEARSKADKEAVDKGTKKP